MIQTLHVKSMTRYLYNQLCYFLCIFQYAILYMVDKFCTNSPSVVLYACALVLECWYFYHLTHWGRNKIAMAAIFQTTFIFKRIFLNENVWILIKISLKFVPKGAINNIPTLVQIKVRCGPDCKPLSEPMMVHLLTHICVTRPQWVELLVAFFVCLPLLT